MTNPQRAITWTRLPAAHAVLSGLLVCCMLILADQLSMHLGLQASQRIVDDVCGGAIAGSLILWFERARARRLRERLQTIRLMNHHVRNALQVIAYSANLPPDPNRISQISDAVKRIEWALREVLPGEVSDVDEEWQPEKSRDQL